MASISVLFTTGAQAATVVNLGSASGFSVLGGSAITNVPTTTMSNDLGLYPGTSVSGAPQTLGTAYVNDGVAQQGQTDLGTAITAATAQPGTAVTGGVLGGQPSFTPGVYAATTMDLAANDSVTLDAQGDPNAVFIFQASGALTTGANTQILFINGAQPCNVFWDVGTATLGGDSTFVGTLMASDSITADGGATIAGRLLANTGALSLDMNTITTSACAAGTIGGPALPTPTPTPTPTGTTPTPTGTTPTPTTGTTTTTPTTGTTPTKPAPTTGTTGTSDPGSGATKAAKDKAARERAAKAKAARIRAAKAKARRVKAAKARARARRLARARALRAKSPARQPTASGGFTG